MATFWVMLSIFPLSLFLFINNVYLGQEKSELYHIEDYGWIYNDTSDATYMPNSRSDGLPPFVIKIQKRIDEELIDHLNEYALQIKNETSLSPIVLIISVGVVVGRDLKSNLEESTHRHLLKLQSYPWAKECLLLSKSTLQIQASEKLNIISALGVFFTAKKESISELYQKDNHYLKLLFRTI